VLTAETIAALDSPRDHLEDLLGNLARQVEEAMPLPTAPFQNTLRQMLEAYKPLQEFDQLFAAGHASQQLSGVLETVGLDSWIETLQSVLDQPHWSDLVEEFKTGGGLADPELQTEFAEALFEQPDWKALVESTNSPSMGHVDAQTAPTPTVKPKRWRMLRQFAKVRGVILQSQDERTSRSGLVRDLILFGIGALYTTVLNQSTESKLDALLEIARQPSAQTSSASPKGHWTLSAGNSMRLNTAPIEGAAQTEAHAGPIRLIETESLGDWVKVTVYGCNGERDSGWIWRSVLDRLDSPDEPACPPDHGLVAPILVVEAGTSAQEAWQAFFQDKLLNPNTRQAYLRACNQFFDWCRGQGLMLESIRATHVADWRDELIKDKSKATVKQYLTAVRRLLDEMVNGHVIHVNPSHSVSAPRLASPRSKTVSLRADEVRQLFDAFEPGKVIDLRDRAVLAVMTFCLAPVSEVCSMRVRDFKLGERSPQVSFDGKRGRHHHLTLSGRVAEWVGAYVETAGIGQQKDSPMFRSFGPGRGATEVTDRELGRQDVYSIVRRRFEQAGLARAGGCHTLRATGITLLLMRGVPIDQVAELAGHASVDMTRRYEVGEWEEMKKTISRMG